MCECGVMVGPCDYTMCGLKSCPECYPPTKDTVVLGQNALLMNQVTMVAAIQEYMDKRWADDISEACPQVVRVQLDADQGHGVHCFKVTMRGAGDDPRKSADDTR